MKKNASRLLSLILCFAMLCGMLPSVRVNAAEIETTKETAGVEVLEKETPTETPTEAESPTETPTAEEPAAEETAAEETLPPETTEAAEAVAGETAPVLNDSENTDLTAFVEAMAAAAAAGETYVLTKSVMVDSNVTLTTGVDVLNGAVLTVASGATLTIPVNTVLQAHSDSTVVVEAGGILNNAGTLIACYGSINVSGSYVPTGEFATVDVHIRSDTAGNVTGISNGNLRLVYDEIASQAQLDALLSRGDLDQYHSIVANMCYNAVLTTPSVEGENMTLAVPENYTATVSGSVDLRKLKLEVNGKLIVAENGSLINSDFLALYGIGSLQLDGELTNNGVLWMDTDGTATINGTLRNYNTIHVGFAGNGTMNINGTLDTYGYLAVDPTGVLNVNKDGVLNILRIVDESGNETHTGYLDTHGGVVNVYGIVNDDALLSVGGEDGGEAELYLYTDSQLNVCEIGNVFVDKDGTMSVSGEVNCEGYLSNKQTLSFDGGKLTVSGSLESYAALDLNNANIVVTEGASVQLHGATTWTNTNMTGKRCYFHVGGPQFDMNGGKIWLQDSSAIVFGGTAELNSGTIDLDDSVMVAACGTNVNKDMVIDIDINTVPDTSMIPKEYVQGSFALELCGYLSVNANAQITIDVAEAVTDQGSFNGILNNGTFHQMGGTVTVNQSKYIAMLTHGVTLVNGGTLNLSADIGYAQGYDFTRPEDALSQFFVDGGTVNATGSNIGILLNGPADWAGGQVNAIATGDGSSGVIPQAVLVQKFTGEADRTGENVSSLTVISGAHNLNAANGYGLSVDNAPVIFDGEGNLVINAKTPVYSLSDSQDSNFQQAQFTSESGKLTLTAEKLSDGTYLYTLPESDGSYATKVTYAGNLAAMTQEEFVAALEQARAEKTDLVITRPVNLDSDVEVALSEGCKLIVAQGGEINLTNNMTLTLSCDTDLSGGAVLVNQGTTLVNKKDLQILSEGLLTVEGTVNNSGNISNYNVLWIDNGGTVNVSGTLKNYQWMHVGYQNEEHSGAGAVTVTGTLTNYGYLSVAETGGILTVSKTGALINAGANEDYWPFIELHGALTVSGTLENSNFISVANEASFQITDGGQYAGLGKIEVEADSQEAAINKLSGVGIDGTFSVQRDEYDDGRVTYTFWKDPGAVAEEVSGILNDTTMSSEDKAEALKDMNTEELKAAMQDPAIANQIADLEKDVAKGSAEVTVDNDVEDEAVKDLANGASVTGAMLNVSVGGGNVSLVIGEAAEEHALAEIYVGDTAIQFSMDLTNVKDSENLSVPVQIKLPIPGELDPDLLVVLHFREDGGCENVQVNITYEDDDQWYVTFVVTGFSDFVMTQTRKGDCNLDGKIDINDAAELLWATIFETEDDKLPVGKLDFNGDERVDSGDVVYLLWHILFQALFPLS